MAVSTDTLDHLIEQIRTNTERNRSTENYPAQLARDIGMTRQTVSSAISWLEKWGLCRREQYDGDGRPPRRVVVLKLDTLQPADHPAQRSVPDLLSELQERATEL